MEKPRLLSLKNVRSAILTGVILCIIPLLEAQYIAGVHEYLPAPGQFINTSRGSPASVLTLHGGIEGTLSLGSFGGYVVFSFEHPVEDHPDNPYGVDFTIFGNSTEDWAEPGIVWVMKDENGNGLPDDIWYELSGSDHFFSGTLKDYRVSYSDPGGSGAQDVPWADHLGYSGVVAAGGFHEQSFYPDPDSFIAATGGSYDLRGTLLPDPVDRSDPLWLRSPQKGFGYADNQPVGEPPYTLPDNPYSPELENSGGDGFDIDWAVDETGQYVELGVIDFVKVQSACMADGGWLGEISTEIRGAVDVPPAPGTTGETEMLVLAALPDTIRGSSYQLEAFAFEKGRINEEREIGWEISLDEVSVDEDLALQFSVSGPLTLTAFLKERPEIRSRTTAILEYMAPAGPVSMPPLSALIPTIYPNPATDAFSVEGWRGGSLQLYDLSGRRVLEISRYTDGTPVQIGHLPAGLYVLRDHPAHREKSLKLIVR